MADFSGLSIGGRIATADDSDWDQARQAWNLAADQHPAAVAFVESADDVSEVVGFARANGLRVTGQGTGHGAVSLGSLEDVILIKTQNMRAVEIENGSARAEAGALAEDVAEAAITKGMCSMPGTSPNVGIAGYTLGGGLSWLGRKYGWAGQRAAAIERGPTARRRSSWSQPTAKCAPSTPRTIRTSSGRCGAGAAGTRSSPRSTASSCR